MKKERKGNPVMKDLLLEGAMNMLGHFTADPLGSYTGIPEDPKEVPVQDADDL